MKTAISLPDSLFEEAEQLAKNLGLNRSQLYARALEAFIQRHDAAAISARLNEIYSEEGSDLDPILSSLQSQSLGDESW
jgi:metal-responsive CopG/Arc/MetJ family transcriptional regulator